MKAIEDLKQEHVVIGRLLDIFERQAADAHEGKPLDTEILRDGLTFVRGFAVGCHHEKEEAGLFPMLADKKAIIRDGPVKVLIGEHEAAKHLMSQLEAALPGVDAGEEKSIGEAVRVLDQYCRLLRKHIEKENELLFVLAEALLSDEEAEALVASFDAVETQIGAGAHHHYEELIGRMEASLAERVS